ncbi:MAG: transposase, partial [Nanoarchaeota archaeon]
IPRIAAHIVLDICKKGKKRTHYLPGIFLVIHTFGRDGKYNIHIHLSVTFGGFLIKEGKVTDQYIHGSLIKESVIKPMWRYQITNLLRSLFKENKLTPYPAVRKHFLNLTSFNKWLDSHYQKTWNVFLQHTQKGAKATVSYLGRYLKRPPIAETRIIAYDGNLVTFRFLDHYTDTNKLKTLTALDFIKMLITHIPDKHFKMIRYYGFLAFRVRNKYLKLFNKNISDTSIFKDNFYLSYLKRFLSSFNYNPLKCSHCGSFLILIQISWALPLTTLLDRHLIKATSLALPPIDSS